MQGRRMVPGLHESCDVMGYHDLTQGAGMRSSRAWVLYMWWVLYTRQMPPGQCPLSTSKHHRCKLMNSWVMAMIPDGWLQDMLGSDSCITSRSLHVHAVHAGSDT